MYFDTEDVRDLLLKDRVTDEDVNESTQYVDGLAVRLNVSPNKIRMPVAYPIKQLALFYALMVCARNQSIMVEGRDMEAGDDPYEKKRAIYEKEYQRWESRITAETFTGLSGRDSGEAIPLTTKVRRG
jgi:hypothetical protein